jgi:hypothetical protein
MEKKAFLSFISIALVLLIALPCWAITINHIGGGNIISEVETTYTYIEDGITYYGDYVSAQHPKNTGLVSMDHYSSGEGSYGMAKGYTTNTSNNEITFGLTTDARSVSGYNDPLNPDGFITQTTVKSSDKIKFQLIADAGENVGDAAQLKADSLILGIVEADLQS